MPGEPKIASLLSDDDKTMLGALYASAEAQGASPGSPAMKKLDGLAMDLALLRITEAMLADTDDNGRAHATSRSVAQTARDDYGPRNTFQSWLDVRA